MDEMNIMPGFDGTGPSGRGVASGRGRGPCRVAPMDNRWNPAAAQPVNRDMQAPCAVQPAGTYGLGRDGLPRGCGQGFCGGRFRRM